VTIAPVASVVRKIEELTPEALDVVSVVLEACPEAAGVRAVVTNNDGCPFRSCLEEIQGACRPSLLAKVCRLLRGFSEVRPAAATDMLQMKPSFKRGFSSPCPLIRMVYEANPAAISHQGRRDMIAFTSMPFGNHRFRSLRVLTVSRGCQAERSWQWRDNSALCSAEFRKYSPGSQLLSREYISELQIRVCPYIHL
jgi:hypothetical protein